MQVSKVSQNYNTQNKMYSKETTFGWNCNPFKKAARPLPEVAATVSSKPSGISDLLPEELIRLYNTFGGAVLTAAKNEPKKGIRILPE